MSKLRQLFTDYGQSMWYDNIDRRLLQSGAIKTLVDDGVRGLTSNPAIFEKAITGSNIYDQQLQVLNAQGKSAEAIFEALAIEDIQAAADILRPVFDESKGGDGYVSMEVSPLLAKDTQGTIDAAKRLWKTIDRPNLMIKIPATDAGLAAIEETLASGINVNVTLLFSVEMYGHVMDAYLAALARRAEAGQAVDGIASVASFFVSRVDSLVDGLIGDEQSELRGKAAIANAKLAYQLYKEKFSGEPFKSLAAKGASAQRPLWASTSTKDPAYPDTLYVDTLIGPNTVNTAPPNTITAWVDHGVLASTVETGLADAKADLQALADAGIDMEAVTEQLLQEGIDKFEKPYHVLLAAIEAKGKTLTG